MTDDTREPRKRMFTRNSEGFWESYERIGVEEEDTHPLYTVDQTDYDALKARLEEAEAERDMAKGMLRVVAARKHDSLLFRQIDAFLGSGPTQHPAQAANRVDAADLAPRQDDPSGFDLDEWGGDPCEFGTAPPPAFCPVHERSLGPWQEHPVCNGASRGCGEEK